MPNDATFYLSRKVDINNLTQFLGSLLKKEIQLLEEAKPDSSVLIWLQEYFIGFPLSVNLIDVEGNIPGFDPMTLAKHLAKYYNMIVATDLPSGHVDERDPYCWCIAEPGGNLFEIDEDTSYIDAEGLILNLDTKRPLQI